MAHEGAAVDRPRAPDFAGCSTPLRLMPANRKLCAGLPDSKCSAPWPNEGLVHCLARRVKALQWGWGCGAGCCGAKVFWMKAPDQRGGCTCVLLACRPRCQAPSRPAREGLLASFNEKPNALAT